MENIEVIQYLENQSKNNLFGSLRFAYIMKFVLLLLLEKIVQSMKKKPSKLLIIFKTSLEISHFFVVTDSEKHAYIVSYKQT